MKCTRVPRTTNTLKSEHTRRIQYQAPPLCSYDAGRTRTTRSKIRTMRLSTDVDSVAVPAAVLYGSVRPVPRTVPSSRARVTVATSGRQGVSRHRIMAYHRCARAHPLPPVISMHLPWLWVCTYEDSTRGHWRRTTARYLTIRMPASRMSIEFHSITSVYFKSQTGSWRAAAPDTRRQTS